MWKSFLQFICCEIGNASISHCFLRNLERPKNWTGVTCGSRQIGFSKNTSLLFPNDDSTRGYGDFAVAVFFFAKRRRTSEGGGPFFAPLYANPSILGGVRERA